MKSIYYYLFTFLLFNIYSSSACTIFTCSLNGEIFSAGNEDDEMSFSRIWFNPRTTDRYGSVCFGFADLQAATAMNEYGLFYDFTYQYNIDPSKYKEKPVFEGDLFFEILGKCKNVPEALEYMRKYRYISASQVTISDAEGRSVVINPGAIVEKTGNYQINTNFNIVDVATGNYQCQRYIYANQMLSGASKISVPFLKQILDRTHQEGKLSTQYSYIFDQKRGLIYVYLFHNYNYEYKIDIKKELAKGYHLENLADHFPVTFAYETFIESDPLQYKKELVLSEIAKNGLDITLSKYLSFLNDSTQKEIAQPLLEVALQLVKNAWNQNSNGKMWEYWFCLPDAYNIRHFKDDRLKAATTLFQHLMSLEKDKKLLNFIYEMYAYVNILQGDMLTGKEYYNKCILYPQEVYPVTYTRATEMLKKL